MIDKRRLMEAMEAVAKKRGPLTLFALLMRAESPGKWDLVIAAPWMDRGKLKAFSYVANEVHARLGDDDIVSLSRIAHLPEDSKALRSILAEVRDSAGEFPLELRGPDLFGLGVVHAIIFHAATFASRGKRASGSRA
jgi:hypothetical protein